MRNIPNSKFNELNLFKDPLQTRLSNISDYWQRLKYLNNLMSLQRHQETYLIIHMWKIINSKTSNDLNISFYNTKRFGNKAKVPHFPKSATTKAKTLDTIIPLLYQVHNCGTRFLTQYVNKTLWILLNFI